MELLTLMQASPPLFAVVAGLVGLVIGSFLNVVIHRLPLMLEREWRAQCAELAGTPATTEAHFNLVVPRSRCPACQAQIRARNNIPLLSWLWLRGRCASCQARISARYPVVEALTGALSAAVAWHFGWGPQALMALLITWYLIAMSGIDLDHQLLPDSLTLPLIWLGLLASLWHVPGGHWPLPVTPTEAIIGAVAGYLFLWGVFHAFKLLTGKEGMGYGDFKLFAAAGAWLGWQLLPLILLLSAAVGAVVGLTLIVLKRHSRERPLPFGPFIAGATWIAMLWGPQIVERYLGLAGLR